MPATVIVGLQWGDEGKGKTTDFLAEQVRMVVRYQGGDNAGHTVVWGDQVFKLHLVPSGVLYPHITSVIGNGVVVNPATLIAELDMLTSRGIDVSRVRVSRSAHVLMPYHVALDQGNEARLDGDKVGTTGRGIGPAYEDKFGRRGIRVLDLRNPERLRKLVERGVAHANIQLATSGAKRADVDYTLGVLEKFTQRLLPLAEDVGLRIHRAIVGGAAVLLEGAQGSLLDIDHGTYPFVTSSSTTSGGAATGVGIAPGELDSVIGVVKAYTTRVGNGPLPTEFDEPLASRIRELGNEFGATTGRPRRCGWFDGVVVRYAARVNGLTDLAVTKLDVLDTLDRIGLCTGYQADGELYDEFPGDLDLLDRAVPRYEWFEGWKTSTAQARNLTDLPTEARRYLDRIQSLVETQITYVSVGTRRDRII